MKNSNYLFSTVPTVKIQRSMFDRSRNYKTTLKGDYIYPVMVDEVYPGDSMKLKVNLFARMATQVVPLLDNCYIDIFAFFVPFRLVWDHWVNFMGEKTGPSDTSSYLIPKILSKPSATGTDVGFPALSLYDYLGCPPGVVNTWMSALYPRSYALIYNEWFRDENLIDQLTVYKGEVDEYSDDYKLQKRAKPHDYYTSCLPWPQRGGASTINIAGNAPVFGNGYTMGFSDGSSLFGSVGVSDGSTQGFVFAKNSSYGMSVGSSVSSGSGISNKNIGVPTKTQLGSHPEYSGLVADLSSVNGITINQLRTAIQFQRLLERDARSGTRYKEVLLGHFGLTVPDNRLQRPEFLGMFTSKVSIQAIAQNSGTVSGGLTPQANLAAMGVARGQSNVIVKSFVEHGCVMVLANIRGDVNYDQGMPRIFSRQTRDDFYWPSYSHLGEQAVLNKEIYCQGDNVTDASGNIIDNQVFGYIGRYDELRFGKNEITGELRGSYPTTLNKWTLTEHFSNLPGLNKTFIEQNTPFARAQAVSSDPTFLVDIWFDNKMARPMPTFATPGLMDHF